MARVGSKVPGVWSPTAPEWSPALGHAWTMSGSSCPPPDGAGPARVGGERYEAHAFTGEVGVDLYWIPLGAGGHSVRFNGVVYEAVSALVQRRPRCDVYHTALEILMPEGDYAVEMTPVPNRRGWERGVVAEGPVGIRGAGRVRILRYEIRRWCDGAIPDLQYSVGGPFRVTDDPAMARRVLDLLSSVPTPTWGRDELRAGEMWSCNSVVSWTLTRAGLATDEVPLPLHGRAPGWHAGITVARRTTPAPLVSQAA
jgi:hypothetical protein